MLSTVRQLLAALLLVASVTGAPSPIFGPIVLQEVEECGATHCQVDFDDEEREPLYIIRGGSMADPKDSCLKYRCQDDLHVVHNYEACVTIDECTADGKAPYKMPGGCCYKCEYLESMKKATFLLDRSSNSSTSITVQDTWGDWTPWTDCSRECGKGRQSRMRDCLQKDLAIINCAGERIQIKECNVHECPIHGGWTDWTEWTECSQTCDSGTQTRFRSCTNPIPMFGGNDCEGDAQETRTCLLRHCPIDCVWEEWTQWSECSVECAGGKQSRTRDMQVEKYGGHPCEGSGMDTRPCNTHFCPIHGGWTEWDNWTSCSVSCGNGTELRQRSCTNPAPQHGGRDCTGPGSQVEECFLRHCPVHCQWLEFSEWSACSLSCDKGTQHRSREYVQSKHGGDDCTGDLREVQYCNTQPCPDPCTDNSYPCFSQDVTCTKLTDTEFECGACPRGMRGNGRGLNGCVPVDECAEVSPCFPGATCHDLLEGYECSSCPSGFHGEGLRGYDIHDTSVLHQVCTDVNECTASPNGGCDALRECENTRGSYVCGPCPPGYVDDGPTGCQFSDPCAAGVHNCQKVDYCNNYESGKFNCYCPHPLIGNGLECSTDSDLDGIPDTRLTIGCDGGPAKQCRLVDNCPFVSNSKQEDIDQDGIGNSCDDDADNDGIEDEHDNCKYIRNRRQYDSDYDGYGDKCDNCRIFFNVDQMDTDKDGAGDPCDSDRDGDGIVNTDDNCPVIYNPSQTDSDHDLWGDACDNCIHALNRKQNDRDQDGIGNRCDSGDDSDKDGIQLDRDNCPGLANSDQLDTDADGRGNPCDDDDDDDGISDNIDNCPLISNPMQSDSNGNSIGDACEMDTDEDEILDEIDSDGDGVIDALDNNPLNKHMAIPSFTRSMDISLNTGRHIKPKWDILSNGTEVRQVLNSGPGLMVGYDSFSSVEYNGTIYVDTKRDDDYVGIVFNYQSNQRFMLVSWKQKSQRYWKHPYPSSKAGIQVQVVNSKTGPGQSLMDAIWTSGDTKNQVDMLYHDPLNRGWEDQKPYTWTLRYSSATACMRLIVYDESGLFLDTKCLCDDQIKGGRLGLYVFSQEKVNFSNIRYGSLSITEEASFAQCKAEN